MNQHWILYSLGELFEIGRGGSPRPIENYITDSPEGLNWIKIGDATGGGKFIERTKEKIRPEGLSKTRQVKVGDFLLTNSMSFGRPYIMATDGCIHDGWLLLRPRNEKIIDRGYFYHLLSSDVMYSQFESRASGSTVKNLNTDIVSSVEVQLPPLDEQRRIAAILDKADGLRQKRKRAIALLDSLTQAIFLEMFGSHDFPKVSLGEVTAEFRYGTSQKSGPTGYPTLRIPNVARGALSLDDLKTVEVGEKEFKRLSLQSGDLLFVRTNGNRDYVGRSAVVDESLSAKSGKPVSSFIFASYLIRSRLIDRTFRPAFVQAYLSTGQGRASLLERSKTSAGQFNINTEGLASIPLPMPNIGLQREFESRIQKVQDRVDTWSASHRCLENLFFSLQHRAFSGQL